MLGIVIFVYHSCTCIFRSEVIETLSLQCLQRCLYFTTDMFLKFKFKLERSYTDFIKKKFLINNKRVQLMMVHYSSCSKARDS